MLGIEESSERKQCRSGNNLNYYCWAYGEEPYDCHQIIDGALPKEYFQLLNMMEYTIMMAFSYSLVSTLRSAFLIHRGLCRFLWIKYAFYQSRICQMQYILPQIIGGDKMAVFKGAGVAIVTPFTDKNEVNYEKLGELIEFQIAEGTDSIIICGTTGEASTLSHEEHLECIRYTVEKVAKRVPVIAGTGSNCTETAIYLSKEAEKYGADALLVVSPYYNKATQKGLIAHFTAIAEAVTLPIILYNVPPRTGCNILPQTVATLVRDVKNIVGMKEPSGNIAQVAELMQLTDGKLDLYSGCDEMVVPLLSLGGIGVISVLSNVAPKMTHDMVMKFLEGDTKGSCALQLKLLPLINALFCEVNPIPVKKAVNLMGYEVGTLRMPLTELEPANAERVLKEMKALGIKTI